ncbi:MAG: sulfatase [bacterium]
MTDKKPNILLITIDSLRADHLGCYGYRHPTSPCIDQMAHEGALFERFFCPAVPTHPSYTTLYTGQHPITHNVVAHHGKNDLARNAPFLPQLLLSGGYTTCAVDDLMRQRLWLGRGYEFYIDPSVRHPLVITVTREELNRRAVPWLRGHARDPFFLLLHYWDPHYPYVPPKAYRKLFYEGNPTDPQNRSLQPWWKHPMGSMAKDIWLRTPQGLITDADYVRALYDQEIRYLDDGVGELLETLRALGIEEDTVVMLLGDHGESMTEHNVFFDHYGLYECVLRPPLIVRWPGRIRPGTRRTETVQHLDVAPTLLEAAGLAVPPAMEGKSFLPMLLERPCEWNASRVIGLECTWQAKWCLRTARYKYILPRLPADEGPELYDLGEDPQELHNLASSRPELAREMEDELEGWIRERLKALGRAEDPLVAHGISLNRIMDGFA